MIEPPTFEKGLGSARNCLLRENQKRCERKRGVQKSIKTADVHYGQPQTVIMPFVGEGAYYRIAN